MNDSEWCPHRAQVAVKIVKLIASGVIETKENADQYMNGKHDRCLRDGCAMYNSWMSGGESYGECGLSPDNGPALNN